LIWLRIGTSGGFLWTRQSTSGIHKMLGSSWVAAQLEASQEGLSSMSQWIQTSYHKRPSLPALAISRSLSRSLRTSVTLQRQPRPRKHLRK
jgi:hypothetical protein